MMRIERLVGAAVITCWLVLVGGAAAGIGGFVRADYTSAALGFLAAGLTAGLVLMAVRSGAT